MAIQNPSFPWVNYKSSLVNNINDSGAVVLTATNVSILESIFVSNETNGIININLKLLRQNSQGEETEYYFVRSLKLNPHQGISIFNSDAEGPIYLQPDDIIYAESDGSSNYFSCIISYDELNELNNDT